ncbi:MAG TPA: hypothetical protein DCQ98_17175 [Planctomycetaceae bacterium]|nr:hypothetical protein [Planctomycetaceae bacterium]
MHRFLRFVAPVSAWGVPGAAARASARPPDGDRSNVSGRSGKPGCRPEPARRGGGGSRGFHSADLGRW